MVPYPAIEPNESGLLEVGDGQRIYWECVGARDGTPAVYLHGGPGGGSRPNDRRLFDPGRYRTVLFDQRGCGRSRPLADSAETDLTNNTTAHLVADIERLREHLGIDRWVVLGVSWGVTLALVYAQSHPGRVRALVLAAVTAGTRRELEWITRDVGRIFPREWDEFVARLPIADRAGNLAAAYARLLADPDPMVQHEAARAWCAWEDTHVSLMPGWTPSERYADPVFRQVFARLVTHYWGNDCFLAEGQIISDLGRVGSIPAVLIHGRHDVSGPLEIAWRLHLAWPLSRLVVLEDAGHGGTGFREEMIKALDGFAS